MRSSLLDQARAHAAGAGLNLFGLVDRARFDAAEPKERRVGALVRECGTVLVLGSAGRSLSQQRERWRRETGKVDGVPVAVSALAAASHIAEMLRANGVACSLLAFDGRCRVRPDRLGEFAGFGTISPVSGLLLHPEFGPWLRIRAALLCEGAPFGPVPDASIAERFHPCCGCSRPCVAACPASVHDGLGKHDLMRCGRHRHAGGCVHECASRSACPIGSEHRDGDDDDGDGHRHTYELATMQRWFGLGVWRFVPKALRRGPDTGP